MKKIAVIANARIPTEKAHGLQMMKLSEAFARLGNEVSLIVPSRRNSIAEDPFKFYKVSKTFSIITIRCPDLVRFGPIGFAVSNWIFAILVSIYVTQRDFDLAHSRDGKSLWVLSWSFKNFLFEVHDDQRSWWTRRVLLVGCGTVMRNQALADLHEKFVGKKIKTLISPSAVSLDEFETGESKAELRQKLGFPSDKKVVLYTGHLYEYKGGDTLADAAIKLPKHEFLFVGGMKTDLDRFRKKYGHIKNIQILGHKPHSEIAAYLRAADLLILPNSAKDSFSLLYTSPIKLFEYMASSTPIVASDIPSIREILNESMAYFFKPDDVDSLVSAIEGAFADPFMVTKAEKAVKEVRKYSYDAQVRDVLAFFDTVK